MATIEELETQLRDLETLVAQALEIAQQHADAHTEEGSDPAILKQRQIIGWLSVAAASSDLTLTTSNADVPGCTLTLPHVGDYAIDAVFDFEFTLLPASATDVTAVGVLTDSGDTEVDTPRGALLRVPSVDDLDTFRATVPQQWAVTTTSVNEVYKLRARKDNSLAGVTIKAIQVHTTIRAHYIGRDVA
jgi:hypothetical protein